MKKAKITMTGPFRIEFDGSAISIEGDFKTELTGYSNVKRPNKTAPKAPTRVKQLPNIVNRLEFYLQSSGGFEMWSAIRKRLNGYDRNYIPAAAKELGVKKIYVLRSMSTLPVSYMVLPDSMGIFLSDMEQRGYKIVQE